MDYIIRGTAAGGSIRSFAITSKDLVEEARKIHGLSKVTTACLGRLLSGGLMMGVMLKGADDTVTLRIDGDGPAGYALVTADANGNAKGYIKNPAAELPLRPDGKLDVGKAFGNGTLSVIKDLGLKEPYSGQTNLVSGEVAEDITYYFAVSEQTPGSVGLGVLVDPNDGHVLYAGGFIIQLMPGATESVITALESRLGSIKSVTSMLSSGMTPEDILNTILEGLDPVVNDRIECRYHCGCNREKFADGIASLSKADILSLIEDDKPAEAVCRFCGSKYVFGINELKNLLEKGELL